MINGSLSPAELFCRSVIDQAEYSDELPYVLNFAPLAQINPFQRLLYCRASSADFAILPAVGFDELAPVRWNGRGVIHLHWLASVLADAKSLDDANIRIDEFKTKLCRWRERGFRIVWTMHNVLPHNSVLVEAEIALRKVVIDQADCIHTLSKSSIEDSRQYFELPESKVFYIPHPTYEGWYANVRDGQNARLELDIEANTFTFVQFGALQRYKGVLELVEAFRRLQSMHSERLFRLVIAGMPTDKAYVTEILEAIAPLPAIRLIQSSVPERDIQSFANAADVMVAPYIKTLNSGVALLAATFGKPLIAPDMGGVGEVFQQDPTLLYDSEDPNGLLNAMERALTHKVQEEVFSSIQETYSPERISIQFFKTIAERLFPEKNVDKE
ncbi:hypothetical protein W822_04165 [Advenella kashmirensis W13003]|uniref:Glycosyl transferase family 1 domain-containing protein n=1 Tax=Advenella kashmirensis W13003 TaxID=1424334 RepID=V8QYJ3_9BURK|nr:hypothetical protein W822_04165 [Advenella kashmirensis W13003]